MIFSEKKLRELANLDNSITLEEITKAINSIGFEVEGVEQFNKNKGLKFGHVLKTEKNPNSNKLNICTIKFNDCERIIQTAAQNVKEGDYLIAFVPGSILNGVEIKAKELGKITSNGMLASLEELGFNSSLLREQWKEDILIIDEVDLNLDPIEYFELNDNLIDVTILTNRSDAQCYFVLAKELSAYFGTKLNLTLSQTKPTLKSNIKFKNSNECNLNGFEVEQDNNFVFDLHKIMFILKSNIKSVDDYEDFSSYIMLHTGAYPRLIDADKLSKNEISIKEKDKIFYLENNGKNISILGTNVDEQFKPNKNTKRILFEISQINSKIARSNSRNSKTTNQSTINSSKKISNGSINMAYSFVSNYFKNITSFINELNLNPIKINFDKEYLNKYAGFDITKENNYKKAIKALKTLDFKINDNEIIIPTYRHDVNRMQDIVEEVFRFYGLNNFKPEQPLVKSTIFNQFNNLEKNITALGYTQAWTYTLINKEKNNEFNPFNFKNEFNLLTYVSEEFNSIRNSIALPIFNIYEYNIKRKITNLSLFDIGMINDKKALLISSNTKSYVEIKEDLERITNQSFVVKTLNNDKLHPNYNAALFLSGQKVGWIGKFNPFWIDSDIIFAEVFLDVIYKSNNQFVEYDNEPLKERDITISVPKDVSPIVYINKINEIGSIYSIDLLSKFNKENKVNWSYKIKMPSSTCELFDKQIDAILKQDPKDIF